MKKILKIPLIIIGSIIGIVVSMTVLNLCPPQGPWPMPPWCSIIEQKHILEKNIILDFPTNSYVNDIIQISASLKEGITPEAKIEWYQLRLPDKYQGSEYISGNKVILNKGKNNFSVSFIPKWPGKYWFKVIIEDKNKTYERIINIPVKPRKKVFELRGIAFGYWHYSEDKAKYIPEMLDRAVEDNANYVMFSPTWYQHSYISNEISPCPLEKIDYNLCRGVIKDETLINAIREAHKRGLKVIIKLHLKVFDESGYPGWPGQIQPSDWNEWFKNYEKFAIHYAKIAEQEGVERFSIGNELANNVLSHTDKWRELISKLRKVYSGKLTYHGFLVANDFRWAYPTATAEFLNDLDCIGVNYWASASGYFGINKSTYPTVEEMEKVIDKWLSETVDKLAKEKNLCVIISEFGTMSYDGSNINFYNDSGVLDNGEQSEFYEAGFRAFASRPYIKGVVIWAYTWEPYTFNDPKYRTMNPLSKPAEKVIKLWFWGE